MGATGVSSTLRARTQLPLKPPSARVLVTTRWHGTSGANGLRRRACAACCSYSTSCRGRRRVTSWPLCWVATAKAFLQEAAIPQCAVKATSIVAGCIQMPKATGHTFARDSACHMASSRSQVECAHLTDSTRGAAQRLGHLAVCADLAARDGRAHLRAQQLVLDTGNVNSA
jgi:hypothetical protein